MRARFDLFAIIAGMRTGSNLLEELLAAHPRISCHGELFNPHFVGAPGQDTALGISRRARDEDPQRLLAAVSVVPDGIAGFRIFDGHDERAIEAILVDQRCAKIILTRNPLESYVSLGIARRTGQWWLGDLGSARRAKVRFDPGDFTQFLDDVTAFRQRVRKALQRTGQTAFELDYSDLGDAEVISGLHVFLGVDPLPRPKNTRTKAQNPDPLTEKVTNPRTMQIALSRLDPFETERIPDFETPRGAAVSGYRMAVGAPVMFQPVGRVGIDEVDGWLTGIGHGRPPERGLGQQPLRAWMRRHPGHRRIAVVEHPLTRLHDAFSRFILPLGLPDYEELRHILVRHHRVPLPEDPADSGYDSSAHRVAFGAFVRFVRGNLGGQTGLRPDPAWASQTTLLQGICRFAPPDLVLRLESIAQSLDQLSDDLGLPRAAPGIPTPGAAPVPLSGIVDDTLMADVAAAYRKDFVTFGYMQSG